MTAPRSNTPYLPKRPPRGQRGQALIMAVLLMFLLVGLGGVFIAMINQTLVQTARSGDRARLEAIARTGLNAAKAGLQKSADGADWRPGAGPDNNNPGWIATGDGFYKVTVTYGRFSPITEDHPYLENPLDRYLKVDVESRFTLDNPPHMIDPQNGNAEQYDDGYQRGRFLPQRYLTRKVTAYVPVALTDYLVWVTNLYDTGTPAALGTVLDVTSSGAPEGMLRTANVSPTKDGDINPDWNETYLNSTATIISTRYLSVYDGPIRAEGDLLFADARVDLTQGDPDYRSQFKVYRRDTLEVVGKLGALSSSSAACRRLVVNGHDLAMLNAPAATANTARGALEPVAARTNVLLVPYLQTSENNRVMPSLAAPKFDGEGLQRYRALTRDSGYFNGTVNTGHTGRGEGIYINNPGHTQGSIDEQRAEWMAGSGACWKMGAYRPFENGKAVKLVLNDWSYSATAYTITGAPTIALSASDPVLYQENGTTTTSVTLPYPRNGVIFAEGNLVVQGTLPASVAFVQNASSDFEPVCDALGNQRPGGWNANDRSIRSYVTPVNRRFDLTIVSAGTIYIEGNLLSPSSRLGTETAYTDGGYYLKQVNDSPAVYEPVPITLGADQDTKIALLAADNVCLNPTRLFEAIANPDGSVKEPSFAAGDPERYWKAEASGSSTFTFSFATAGDPHPFTRLLLRHAGNGENESTSATMMQMGLNAQPYNWNPASGASAANLYFCNSSEISSLYDWLDLLLPKPLAQYPEWVNYQWGGGRSPGKNIATNTFIFNPFDCYGMQSWDISYARDTAVCTAPLWGFNRRNQVSFTAGDDSGDPHDGSAYLLHAGNWGATAGERFGTGCLVTCLDLQVDALVYAQRGSWFIIPGRYWYDSDEELAAPQEFPHPFPQYREPYDVRITVNGAIAQNSTAPPEMERAWTEHWRGANIWYFDANGNGIPDLWDPGWDEQANASRWLPSAWRWKGTGPAEDNRRMGIVYTYDATLARPVCFDVDPADPEVRYYRSRLPKLPVGSPLLSISEMRGA